MGLVGRENEEEEESKLGEEQEKKRMREKNREMPGARQAVTSQSVRHRGSRKSRTYRMKER